jgi:type VII secretion integral membrane protein EccD
MSAGLARITVSGPQRRVDLALPEHVPLAELLPEVLRHAGDGLADDGEQHGGWVLRRTDGTALRTGQALQQQGVRDGEVLHLVPARVQWPEPEYDDVVEAIAEGARRAGAQWSGAATRAATLVAASVALAVGLLAVLYAGPAWTPGAVLTLGLSAGLCLAGVIASRAYGDAAAGATLGAWAMPYAFFGAALLISTGDPVGVLAPVRWIGAPEALAGSVALLLAALLAGLGVVAGLRVFTAGMTIGAGGAVTALAGFVLPPASAAAILVSALICGVGLLPLLAIRLGNLPLPATGRTDSGQSARPRLDQEMIFVAVARSEELLAGMLIGHALLVAVAALVLVASGGPVGRILAAMSATAMLLRARLFVSLRHRVPLVAAGLLGLGMVGLALADPAGRAGLLGVAAGAPPLALLIVAAGAVYSRRPPSPYLARAADLLDTVLLISVVPVACAVLGLYARARGLLS